MCSFRVWTIFGSGSDGESRMGLLSRWGPRRFGAVRERRIEGGSLDLDGVGKRSESGSTLGLPGELVGLLGGSVGGLGVGG